MTEAKQVFIDVFSYAVLFLFLFEILSFFGFLFPLYSGIVFMVILALAMAIGETRMEWALLILLAELFVGSQGGYHFSLGGEAGLNLSIRIGLFVIIIGMWIAGLVGAFYSKKESKKQKMLGDVRRFINSDIFKPYIVLMMVILAGAVRGIFVGNSTPNVFFDANGYAYFALLPLFVITMASMYTRVGAMAVLSASIVVTVVKALLVEFIFSHRLFYAASPLYTWIRDTRVGEITIMAGDFYRIFFQAYLFALTFLFVAILYLMYEPTWREKQSKMALGLVVMMSTAMLLSLSRSFWFGGFVSAVLLVSVLWWAEASRLIWKRLGIIAVTGAVGSMVLLLSIYFFPFPQRGGDVSFAQILSSRAFSVSGEAAANSRWALLPILNDVGMEHPIIGSGLGTTATYTTSDPRLLADNPSGEYTTFAFEWGYHDLWVKFGLVGLAAYGWFIYVLMKPWVIIVWQGKRRLRGPLLHHPDMSHMGPIIATGVILGVVALLATNVFSPYLNHPLGIGMLMIIAAYGSDLLKKEKEEKEPKPMPVPARDAMDGNS